MKQYYIRVYTNSRTFDVIEDYKDQQHLKSIIEDKFINNSDTYIKCYVKGDYPIYIKSAEIIAFEGYDYPFPSCYV